MEKVGSDAVNVDCWFRTTKDFGALEARSNPGMALANPTTLDVLLNNCHLLGLHRVNYLAPSLQVNILGKWLFTPFGVRVRKTSQDE